VNEQGDTANVSAQAIPGIQWPYTIYAHLHLMAAQNRLDRWLPEAAGASDFELERAILARVSDSWLYQRSIFDAPPYGILDELMYSKENGYLQAFILTARPDAFVEARRDWLAADPGAQESYVAWFRRAFERDPPGARGATGTGSQSALTRRRTLPQAGPASVHPTSTSRAASSVAWMSTRPVLASRESEGLPPKSAKPSTPKRASLPSGAVAVMTQLFSSLTRRASPFPSRSRRIRPPWG